MLLSSYDHSFIVQATVITIINYSHTIIMIINSDCKTFIVQATGLIFESRLRTWSPSVGDLRLVIRSKCRLETNREKMQIMGTMSLATFLIISLINCTFCSISVSICFSLNGPFYCRCSVPLPAMLCLSHTHSLSVSPLFCSLPLTFRLI